MKGSNSWQSIYKVDSNIKPIHYKYRKPVELHISALYNVSFEGNKATICKLVDIQEAGSNRKIITIEITAKKSPKAITYPKVKHTLFDDEIGLTPEEAVKHQVTL